MAKSRQTLKKFDDPKSLWVLASALRVRWKAGLQHSPVVAKQQKKNYTYIEKFYSREVCSMSGYNIDIADMQCWVFRMAQSKWKMSPSDCTELFKKYDILGFIADCYDILHLNSYECALHDVETLLKNRGVTV